MSKKDFLKRCENAYDMDLVTPKILNHLMKIYDGMHRLEGGQIEYFTEMLISENERTRRFSNDMQLANDELGYNCIRLLAILVHGCQKCAEDPKAWHTRQAFCEHKNDITSSTPPKG